MPFADTPATNKCHWIEYLDDLPFPAEQLPQHRSEVCDYCFYGGPYKTDPLI